MRQVQIDEFGGPEVLRLVEAADPRPGPGQVVVRAAAAGITFVETQVRAGRPPWPGPGPALPAVLGNGIEGEIISVGAGADGSLLGRRVVTATGGLGGYAEQAAVGAGDPVPAPAGLPRGAALAMLADGRTAVALARAAAITGADAVLVTAAAGGVGSLLVQLARRAGARQVIAAASSERKLALAASLGADAVVDYTAAGWAGRLRELTGGHGAGGLDVAFDGIGGEVSAAVAALVRPGGRFLAYGAASGAFADAAAISGRGITLITGRGLARSPAENRALVEEALALAAAGILRPVIGQVHPLAAAGDAHAAIEARVTTGKTILIPSP